MKKPRVENRRFVSKQLNHSISHFVVIFIGVFLLVGETHADILPYENNGVSIVPIQNSKIRMRSETVTIDLCPVVGGRERIYIGKVKAVFHMDNLLADKITIDVGFPVDTQEIRLARENVNSDSVYDFKVKVNGSEVAEVTPVSLSDDYCEEYGIHSLLGWENEFLPGDNTVEVEYRIYSNQTYDYHYENIHFILSSGSLWYDKIDSAKIAINCPRRIDREQIMPHTNPANYALNDSSIIWYFEDFEPTKREDIRFEFMPFDMYNNIKVFRRKIADDPADDKARISLV